MDKVHRFVALAPCHYYRETSTYEIERLWFQRMHDLGIYNLYGNDMSSLNSENCSQVSEPDCGTANWDGYGESIASLMYFSQIAFAG